MNEIEQTDGTTCCDQLTVANSQWPTHRDQLAVANSLQGNFNNSI